MRNSKTKLNNITPPLFNSMSTFNNTSISNLDNIDNNPNWVEQEFITILQLNVNKSLTNRKLPYIRELITCHSPEVICFNEIGIDREIKVFPTIPGYTPATHDLSSFAAGVATYVHDSLKEQIVTTYIKHTMTKCQACAIEINGIRIINVYRSPNQPRNEVSTFVNYLRESVTSKTIIVGDLNLRCNWLEYTSTEVESRMIVEELFDLNMVQYQFLVTRQSSGSILDVTLSNDYTVIMDASTDPLWSCDGVDHTPTITRLRLPVRRSLFRTFPAKKKLDKEAFREQFQKYDISPLFQTNDISKIDECLTQVIVHAAEVVTPKVKIDLMKPKPPVEFSMTEETREMFAKQREAMNKKDKKRANILHKEVRRMLRKDKSDWMMYRARKLDANNDEVWNLVRNASDTGVATGGLRLDDTVQELEFDPEKKPEILNTRYQSVMTPKTHPTCDGTDLHGSQTIIQLTDIEISEADVIEALSTSNNSYANDTEGVNVAMLRKLSDLIAPVLTFMFTLSFECAQLAILWLTSMICPIPKPGDPTLAKSLRPVVLENSKLRIMERVVNSKIVTYLDSIGFFHRQQFGFRKGRNCISNLTDYWTFVTDLMARRSMCDVVYMDTSAAFDRLSHGILLDKLYHECGIAGKLWLWLKAWLSDRWQFVRLNGHDSTKIPVTSSCMQGSCLGTTLWNIYINDVCFLIEQWIEDYGIEDCCFFLYADDIKIAYYPSERNVEKINKLLKNLSKEMKNLYLNFNPDKCSVLTMGLNNQCMDVFLPNDQGENILLKRVDCERDLGLQVSSDGVFSKHLEKSLNTAKFTARFLSKIFHTATWGTKVQLYYGLIFSRMSYASELWRPLDMSLFNKVYVDFFKFTKPPKKANPPWIPEQLMIKKDLTLLWQIFNDKSPVESWKIFPDSAYDNSIKRNRPRAQIPTPKYNPWKKNLVLTRNLTLWNSIPLAVRQYKRKNDFEEYVEDNILVNLECESIRRDVLSGEMRRKAKKHLKILTKQRQLSEDNLRDGNAPGARPDSFFLDSEMEDDFLVSDHCQKTMSRKSQATMKKLAQFAPHMNLCYCNNKSCQEEVTQFEAENGPIRLLPKAYVNKAEVVKTTKGKTLSYHLDDGSGGDEGVFYP